MEYLISASLAAYSSTTAAWSWLVSYAGAVHPWQKEGVCVGGSPLSTDSASRCDPPRRYDKKALSSLWRAAPARRSVISQAATAASPERALKLALQPVISQPVSRIQS